MGTRCSQFQDWRPNVSLIELFPVVCARHRGSPRGLLQEPAPNDVVDCLSRGALQGQSVTIIGHAAPRGGNEYNMELGQSRADATRNYLVNQGVAPPFVATMSRGEQAASGMDEQSWAFDRRVDLVFGETNPTRGMLPTQ